jgi:hypothetical protein
MYLFSSRGAPKFVGGGRLGGGRQKSRYFLGGGGLGKWVGGRRPPADGDHRRTAATGGRRPPARAVSASGYGTNPLIQNRLNVSFQSSSKTFRLGKFFEQSI